MEKLELAFKSFREISFGLRDVTYFEDVEIEKNKLLYDISFDTKILEHDTLEIVLHAHYIYDFTTKEAKLKTIFHGDFVSEFGVKNLEKYIIEENQQTAIDFDVLKMLLGISISTTRGYLLARTKGSIVQNYPLPLIYPENFIKEKCEFLKDDYVAI